MSSAITFPAPVKDWPAPEAPGGFLEILTLERQLAGQGYSAGAPRHVTPETLATDAAAAREAGCPDCGCHDLDFLPLRRGGSYRAVVTCPACLGEWEA
jgi:hypothetical protein